jgi:hypothetical protein
MSLSTVTPVKTTPTQHFDGKVSKINLGQGFTWFATVWIRPQPVGTDQVILDIGKSGKTADRLQLYFNQNGDLVFKVCGHQLQISKSEATELQNRWVGIVLQASVSIGRLRLKLKAGKELEWSENFPYNGPQKI